MEKGPYDMRAVIEFLILQQEINIIIFI